MVSGKQLGGLLHSKCQTFGCQAPVLEEETKISRQVCGDILKNVNVLSQGAALHYQLSCLDGHKNSWWTDDFFKRKTAQGSGRKLSRLNCKLASFLLLTGGNFDPMKVGVLHYTLKCNQEKRCSLMPPECCLFRNKKYVSLFQGFFRHMKIPFIGKTAYYRFLGTYVYPCIWGYSLVQQNKLLEECKVRPI